MIIYIERERPGRAGRVPVLSRPTPFSTAPHDETPLSIVAVVVAAAAARERGAADQRAAAPVRPCGRIGAALCRRLTASAAARRPPPARGRIRLTAIWAG